MGVDKLYSSMPLCSPKLLMEYFGRISYHLLNLELRANKQEVEIFMFLFLFLEKKTQQVKLANGKRVEI